MDCSENQAGPPRPPVCAPAARSRPPAHHRAGGRIRPHRDRRPRRGRDETQYGAARLPARGLRHCDGCGRATVGVQDRSLPAVCSPWPIAGLPPARSTTVAPHRMAHRAGWPATAVSTSSWCAHAPVNSSTAITTLREISVTGRITPVVAQLGPRPHRYPGQPPRLVQAMAPTPDYPAPAELL